MKILNRNTYLYTTLMAVLFLACSGNNGANDVSIAPFQIIDDTTIRLHGEINSDTELAFDQVMRQNPNTELIIFGIAPGSDDDETNLRVGRKVHQLGLNTHVEDNGEIASGAVDLFLAGARRSLGSNAMVGVHSWSDGRNEATDFPRDSEEHLFFIEYYIDIGMTEQQAEDFYFFTINAAPADDIHWMTASELTTYQLTTN